MKNNLAELQTIKLDSIAVRQSEWEKQVAYQSEHKWTTRNFVEFSFFTEYFQKLLMSIEKAIGEVPTTLIVQLHDISLNVRGKTYLQIPHRDESRLSCISIPITYDLMEPVLFYIPPEELLPDLILQEETNRVGGIDGVPKYIALNPDQIGKYSINYPTLMNVGNWHSIRTMSSEAPRIFIQMSFNIPFDTFVDNIPEMIAYE